MGNMSASDAAPLPRLGEVYFDVRGESRSMRLSWYADTGVAVFSIWQGGTCTGTFRLPIADLPRMVQALQRGPDGDADEPLEPSAAGQAQPRGPARDPQPAMPDGDIETGPHPAPSQRPRSGRHHGPDRVPAGYAREAVADYGAEPGAAAPAGGYSGDLDGGYTAARPSSRHSGDLPADYGQPSGGRPGGYGDEADGGRAGGRRTGGHRAGGPADEPTSLYHDPETSRYEERPPGRYTDEPTSLYHDPETSRYEERPPGRYTGEPTSLYHDPETSRYEERPPGRYTGEPAGPYHEPETSRYEERPTGGYAEGSHRRGYDDERPAAYQGGGYHQEATGPYPDDSLPGSAAAYHDEELPGGFEREPARPYPGDPLDTSRPLDPGDPLDRADRRERPERPERQRTAAYSARGYEEDEPTGIYRGDMLSHDFDDRPAGRYPDPDSADYPTGPSGPIYPGAAHPRDYPGPHRDEGYPAARPYLDPRSREGRPSGERPARSRRRDDDADSFPYGPPPTDREVRGRAR
jgi:hypothetical protein